MKAWTWWVFVACLTGWLTACDFSRPAALVGDADPTGDPLDARLLADSGTLVDGDALVDSKLSPRCGPTARFGPPIPMLEIAMTSASDPQLSLDERTLYFAGSQNGESGLYIARRNDRAESFGSPMLISELKMPSAIEGGPTVTANGLTPCASG